MADNDWMIQARSGSGGAQVSVYGGVDRMPPRAVDLDLLEERERHAVVHRAELADLLGRAGLLPAELVAGKADHREPTAGEPLLQPLQPLVLRRQAALRGDVDHE